MGDIPGSGKECDMLQSIGAKKRKDLAEGLVGDILETEYLASD